MPDLAAAPPRTPADRWGSRRDTATLVGFALAFGLLDVVICLSSRPTTGWAGPRADLLLQLAVDASLVFLGRFPRQVSGVVLVVVALTLLSDTFSPGLFSPVEPASPLALPRATPVVVIYLVRRQPQRVALPLVALFALAGSRLWEPSWTVTPVGLLSTTGPAVVVLYLDARRQLLRSLRDRAERAEREKHLLAAQARSEERRRLAAEMHDVLSHGVSLMVLHAGSLGVTSSDPAVREAAEEIRAAGAMALDELRDLIGVLNGEPDDTRVRSADGEPDDTRVRRADGEPGATLGRRADSEPDEAGAHPPGPSRRPAGARRQAPPVPDPAALAEESAAAGFPVELDVEGERSLMSPTIARTVHRIVREALTNTRKHAPGAHVRVRLRYRPDGVTVRVVNGAAARPADEVLAGSGSGLGLAALEHRVDVVGGTLRAGPTGDGGFLVAAELPAYVSASQTDGRPATAHG
ncbi:histidine kinase [Sphaerisporangium sp. NPDC005288]|uniref:sensor histidine kinase n=1 Tax=Sphaerisporangium sp. NPDC005288 TaxID=3155114 RepID=UPI00339F5490